MDSNDKRKKYLTSFREEWLLIPTYKSWLQKESAYSGKCKLCFATFTVKYDGKKAVDKHAKSARHMEKEKLISKNNLIEVYMPDLLLEDNNCAVNAELAMVYHAIKHQHSYISTDCGIKLNCKIFSQTALSKSIHCGRTKCSAMAENILGPKSIELVLNDLKNCDTQVYFSISSDASNRGYKKLFPIVVTYFTVDAGIQNKLINFYSDEYESSQAIFDQIMKCLTDLGLPVDNVTSYSADNANVNYGVKNSVYQKLLEINSHIVKANCNAHVIHNAAKFACVKLPLDITTLVNKIYSEFSSSTVNVRELKECCNFFNLEFSHIIKNVPTRWLSLQAAVDRILSCWPALKQYFLNQGEDECDPFIFKIIKDQEHEIEDDLNSPTLNELYLYFIAHFLNIMCETILILEKKSHSS